jgi:hypothetical protein
MVMGRNRHCAAPISKKKSPGKPGDFVEHFEKAARA